MSTFSEAEKRACSRLIDLAFKEDRGGSIDLTCAAVIPLGLEGQALFVARTEGVVAGLPLAPMVYEQFRVEGETIAFEPLLEDGAPLEPGTPLARVRGGMSTILS